jgi:alkyl hydroperoxide reductase subunit AhpF
MNSLFGSAEHPVHLCALVAGKWWGKVDFPLARQLQKKSVTVCSFAPGPYNEKKVAVFSTVI